MKRQLRCFGHPRWHRLRSAAGGNGIATGAAPLRAAGLHPTDGAPTISPSAEMSVRQDQRSWCHVSVIARSIAEGFRSCLETQSDAIVSTMNRIRIVCLALICFFALFAALRATAASVVKVEFTARALPPTACARYRYPPAVVGDPDLAASIAPPGSAITGNIQYELGVPVAHGADPGSADYYYFSPGQLKVSLSIGKHRTSSPAAKGAVWISASLVGRLPGQPKLGLTGDMTQNLEGWPGDADELTAQLVLRLVDSAPRIPHLPGTRELNATPLSPLSNFSLVASGPKAASKARETKWMVCADLLSIVASDVPAN